jgi:hypothetical protein
MNAFTSVSGNACAAIVPNVWRRSWKRPSPAKDKFKVVD